SARDFPRHWKVLVQYVRNERPKEICPIILLKGDNFPLEETSKAFFLGISGVVSEALSERAELDRLQGILSRYIPLDEKRKVRRYQVENWNRFGLLLYNHHDKVIVSGEVMTVSSKGVSFAPANADMMKNIRLNMEFPECSLRAGNAILSPVCVLVRTGRVVSLEFKSFPENEQTVLDKYLEGLPLLKLKSTEVKNREEEPEDAEELAPVDAD
ncbi:MAG: PilZ domain-containing protein, partial [Treponema sp.]|nr:PilZ domain-containing protein [Treponema sp.]